jgi:hypothetical protein
MLPVYQAFDRVKFSEVPTDDGKLAFHGQPRRGPNGA